VDSFESVLARLDLDEGQRVKRRQLMVARLFEPAGGIR
jgi:hypothetical protein